MEKGGSVGCTRPHSAQGPAVPGRLAGPCSSHTLPRPGSHCCWPGMAGWLGWQQLPGHRVGALRGPSLDLECLEPCHYTCCLCPMPWGASWTVSGGTSCPSCSYAPSPWKAPRTQDLPVTVLSPLREDVTMDRRPNFLTVIKEG